MNRIANLDINVGLGDHLFTRIYLEGIKHQFSCIAITHSKPGMTFWHNNNAKRWEFNLELGKLLFSSHPYVLVPNARFPFFPNDRIVKELNDKPMRPDLDFLAQGQSLNIGKYVVLATKVRQFDRDKFHSFKDKLIPALQSLAERYQIVIVGEKIVESTREYLAECNKNNVFSVYDFYKEVFKDSKNVVDLTIEKLGIEVSEMSKFRNDCFIIKEAEAAISFGISGSYWINAAISKRPISFRQDNEPTTDLMENYEGMKMTKNIDTLCEFINHI